MIPSTCLEKFLHTFFCDANIPFQSNASILTQWLLPLVNKSKHAQYLILHRLILRQHCSRSATQVMISGLLIPAQPQAGSASMKEIFELWSYREFIHQTNYKFQKSMTFAVLVCLRTCSSVDSASISILFAGIQEHLNSSIVGIRHLGMIVGEHLSRVMNPNTPLCFDREEFLDLDSDFELDLDSDLDSDLKQQDEENGNIAAVEQKPPIEKTKQSLAFLNPDTDMMLESGFSSEEEKEEDSDSDLSLDAYDLADDELDLAPCPKPVYLSKILATFQNTGSKDSLYRDEFEAALDCVANVVNAKPHDLPYVSGPLASVLLRLEDPFSTPDFVSKRHLAIVACCVQHPVGTVPLIIQHILDPQMLYQYRLDGLYGLIASAEALANGKSGERLVDTGSGKLNIFIYLFIHSDIYSYIEHIFTLN